MQNQRFDQTQSLTQQQVISPQIQQSLQVLQASTLELKNLILQEISINPVLDEISKDISIEEVDDVDDQEDISEKSQIEEEWRDYFSQQYIGNNEGKEASKKYQFIMDSIESNISFQEHLLNQLGFLDISDEIKELAEMLIGNIDDIGFLRVDIEDLSITRGIPFLKLQKALDIIKSFDPVGVGASSLKECLLIQLDRLGKKDSLSYSIVNNYLDKLAKNQFPYIAKQLSVNIEEVSLASEFISLLNPNPGSNFSNEVIRYIIPDIIVKKIDSKWIVYYNNDQLPSLKINNSYKDLISSNKNEIKEYVRDKIKSGKNFIKSINQRRETISAIAEKIVEIQNDFFEIGISELKPMTMVYIASLIGVHETTVSRAVSEKYMLTPYGIFSMRYFFTYGYKTNSGDDLSNKIIKNKISELISNEDPKKPLSDAKIVQILEKEKIKVSRRTITKYRQELKIKSSNIRRKF